MVQSTCYCNCYTQSRYGYCLGTFYGTDQLQVISADNLHCNNTLLIYSQHLFKVKESLSEWKQDFFLYELHSVRVCAICLCFLNGIC